MELQQTTIKKNFHVKVGNKSYYVDYLNSDGHTLGLLNRSIWEVYDGEGEEITLNHFKGMDKMGKERINKNHRLVGKIIDFCVKNFNNYNPQI